MIEINISKAQIGMVLAKAVYDDQGKLLLEEDTRLKEVYIENLKKYRIQSIYIANTCNEIITRNQSNNKKLADKTIGIIRNSYISLKIAQNVNVAEIENIILEIVEDLTSGYSYILNINKIKNIDEYNYNHSINATILALVMGTALGLNDIELKKLGTGAILHDIGKLMISDKILNKPDLLTDTEYQIIQRHPQLGYKIAGNIQGISKESTWVIRDHHERYDGRGYPNGLKGESIHKFARIVAICDVYDALTSNRIYRKGIPPNKAIEYLISMGNHQFDYKLVRLFIKQICIYPIGTMVRLVSGEEARVIKNHVDWPTRPIVRILKNKTGQPLSIPKEIDLTKNLDNHVADILNIAL